MLSVRARQDHDLEPLVRVLGEVHRASGYPVRRENVRAAWLASPGELGAWVAALDDRPAGHIALHLPQGASASLWRAAAGGSDDDLAVISRFFSVARGAGSALIDAAVAAAREAQRTPVLEVQRSSSAYGFYLRRGWEVIGELEQQWGEPVTVAAMILRAPA